MTDISDRTDATHGSRHGQTDTAGRPVTRRSSAPLASPQPAASSIAPPDSIGLVDTAAPSRPVEFAPTPTPPFPAPSPLDQADRPRRPVAALAITAAMATAAVVMGWLYFGAHARADDAETATREAIADRTAEADARVAADAEVTRLRDESTAARAGLDQAQNDASVSATEVIALAAQVGALEADVTRLEAENADLLDDLAAAEASAAEASSSADDGAPSAADATFDSTTLPEFTRYIGETLSSRNGSSRLAQAQSECFGAAIIDQIGLDALGAGLNLAATSQQNDVVVDAMQSAASTCGIDPGLIFG